jgi:ribose transport system ATP-binding protein
MSKQENSEALSMTHISKTFGPVRALDDVSFSVRAGTVHALCGENGAGKSTLMKILAGVYQPDAGTIRVFGVDHRMATPSDALSAGISMLYQELDLAEDLTVYENVFLGREMHASIPFMVDHAGMIEKTRDLCSQYGFDLDPTATIRQLTPGQCQVVELLKALMREARIIVMDEPTSSLSEAEAASLFRIVDALRHRGLAIVYISHRMEEIKSLADEITVLRDGAVAGGDKAGNLTLDQIVKLMVGREIREFYPPRAVSLGDVLLDVDKLESDEGIRDVSFTVRHGEVVGMAGLVGAGRTETARALFGVQPLRAGTIHLNGHAVNIRNPADAIRNGMALLTEDRKRTGLCTELPCSWNLMLPNYARAGMRTVLDLGRERSLCMEYGEKVKVKWRDPEAPASSLSGGNQQKVLIARWLLADAQLVIVDEPTRGIDVGAKKEVYALINELAASGKAILLISSELPELFGVCDRLLVMRRGQLVGDLKVAETTPEDVMHLAAG